MIGGIIGAFFIPEGSFGYTWMIFGMIGGFCFIVIQLILIIDFAHAWAEKWVCKYIIFLLTSLNKKQKNRIVIIQLYV